LARVLPWGKESWVAGSKNRPGPNHTTTYRTNGGYVKSIHSVFSTTVCCLLLTGAAYADDCGEAPKAPDIVDGASATMETLVANSAEVKKFIAAADANLDCREAFAKSDDFKAMSHDDQVAYSTVLANLLQQRNAIGDQFNAQVAAYKKAHPGN
jgi:hypothetical protein